MFERFMACLVLFIICFVPVSAVPAENPESHSGEGAVVTPGKCWVRTWITSEALLGENALPVCKAFEEVLNATCEPPEKLQCHWTLPPGEKRFEKLRWQPIDWREHWGLVRDVRVSGIREDLREDLWKRDETRIRGFFEAGLRRLAVSTADVDQNGLPEQIVRYDLLPCDKTPGAIFGAMNPQTDGLDWRFENLFMHANAREGAEIMLYEGKAYMLGWNYVWKIVMVYEGFSLWGGSASGSINVCQFKYLKGGNEK